MNTTPAGAGGHGCERSIRAIGIAPGTAASGATKPLTAGAAVASPINPTGLYGNTYTYGSGSGARRYRAYGYGSGYRNRYYGRRYGYGRSQGSNRAIISRLRSVQMQLARIDHDYQGHRVRAMHQVSMAIRQLSHRSMIYSGVGFAPGMNNGRGMGMGQGGIGGRGGARAAEESGVAGGQGECPRPSPTRGWATPCEPCKGSTCSSAVRGASAAGTPGRAGTSCRRSMS